MTERSEVEIVNERIRILRDEKKESQRAFAERCGFDPNTLSNLKRAKSISYDLIKKIADNNNVSIDWLVGRTDIREIQKQKADDYAVDYEKLEYGYVYNILAYLSAIKCLQIVKTADGIILRVRDERIAKFLDTLQQLARMATANYSVCTALKTWIDTEFDDDANLSILGEVFNSIDKYSDAFPWKYCIKNNKTVEFDFSDGEWCDDSPVTEWDANYDDATICEHPLFAPYDSYEILNDGIVGYYNHKYPYPEPPKRPTKAEDNSTSALDDFMNIPDGINEELPWKN